MKGGVQVSNVTKQNVISYDEVKDSHFSTKSKLEPENKKTKLEEVHDDEYQKKLFTAAQEREQHNQYVTYCSV